MTLKRTDDTRNASESSTACLLCGNGDVRLLQRVRASKLQEAYREELGIVCEFPVDELSYLQCNRCDLLFFSPPITGDESFYEQLQKIPWYYNAEKQEFRIAARHVLPHHDLLEVGAGRGLFSKMIQPRSYAGLEFSPTAIQLAAQDGIVLLPETIEHHSSTHAAYYDVVCAFQVLEHVKEPRSFLEAAVTCLKPGGTLIVSVPGEDSFARFAYWDLLNMPPHHVTRWTDAGLSSIAELCVLRLVALTPEPLGRNMVKPYARAVTDHALAANFRFEPELLDSRLKTPAFRMIAALTTALFRRRLKISSGDRRGHAVVAVFQK